ncbi:hypothetical protein M1105_04020 [Limibaculum sp. FT325]|nr:hypothetical protein [Limibaculum sediminis]
MAIVLATQAAAQAPHNVGSDTCATCHAAETESWAGSHHALAWTRPRPPTVLGDFDDAAFTHDDMTARFSRDGEGYRISVRERDESERSYPVHSVAGIEPLQQYLLETEPGRLQSFDVAWDVARGRWYHLYPDAQLPPSDGLHWTGPYKNWNGRCAECHATGYEKNYDHRTRAYASSQAEIGVGCEACHGPGSAHVDWARTGRTSAEAGLAANGLAMGAGAGTEVWIQQCAGCHSRREPFGDGNPVPGTPYHDAYRLALLQPGLYHADGQILDEVYVYGSFLQSRMYAQGVGCGNCHDPHAARLKAAGNAVCTQCHSPAGNPGFPTLRRAEYDTAAHHFHPPGSDGAQCRNCHMPERTYMGIDARSDHSFRIPRPDLAAKTGAPDTCTACHEDRDPAWAAARIAQWYPDSANRGPHFGEAFALGRIDPGLARDDLLAIALKGGAPDIVRATALSLLEGVGDPAVADAAVPLLADASPLVRAGAVRVQRAAGGQDRVLRIVDLLDDPVRLVRFAAAQEMLSAPVARLPKAMDAAMRRAMAEWQASLATRLDFPETHIVLGGIAMTTRRFPAALGAFRSAVELDPQRLEAWSVLVRLTAALEGAQAARAVLVEALRENPGAPELVALEYQFGR